MRLIDADALKNEMDDWWHPDMTVREIWFVLDRAPTVSGWISVKDRLPNAHKPVLWWCIHRGIGHIRMGVFEGTVNHDMPDVSCCGFACKPYYWMPLPEPPKEEIE